MALTVNGINYICYNFGGTNHCCVLTGLSWYYTIGGTDYNETGGTAQIVARLASGLIDSLTMVSPATGTFTLNDLNSANGQVVTIEDAQTITLHDEPTEDQWCWVPEICLWIDSKGGATAITIIDVFEGIDSYLFNIPPSGYSFIPTITEVMGIIDYFLGFIASGNQQTGCGY